MAHQREAYESYEGFLQAALKEYWDSGRASRINFLALLLASREAWSVAWEGAAGTGKKVLAGAAGAAALAVILRVVVGGPIGLILGGATIASLVGLYVKNHREIWAKQEEFKRILDAHRPKWIEIRDDYLDAKLRTDQRDLMMEGLMSRLLDELDAFEPEPATAEAADDDAESDESGDRPARPRRESDFARHAAKKRRDETRETENETKTETETDE
jgi:hypothetical protein